MNLVDFSISDQKAVLFWIPFLSPELKPPTLIHSRPVNLVSVPHFFQAFKASDTFFRNHEHWGLTVGEAVSVFNSLCTNILDSVVPVRHYKQSSSLQWFDEEIRNL